MNINKIIKQGLTGEEVGKLMIKDLAFMYKQVLEGEKEPKNILSQAEIKALVDSVKTNKDIRDYNNYKKLFDYLKNLSPIFSIHYLDAESMWWKLYNIITKLHNAEKLNYVLRFKPQIKNTLLKKEYMAENILNEYKYIIPVILDRIKEGVKESLVIKETLKLLSEYIDIPEIEIMVGEVTLIDNIILLNDVMESIQEVIFRPGDASELKKELKEVLKPIKTEDLKPTPEAIKKANKLINLDIFVNNEEEKIYQILRGAE